MDRLNQLSKYFNEKKIKKISENTDPNALPEMTSQDIIRCCLENDGYETPELNDKLYLHFRGYRKIENLEPYSGCKSIWLDSNGLDTIEGLDTMSELRCLFLGKNLISHINGLENLRNLTILDLSYNRLSMLVNLSCCPNLQTLNVARNALADKTAIEHLIDCPSLNTLDITNNRLEGEDALDVFYKIPVLVSLSINGNEITKLPYFRKRMIVGVPKLGYLDRPIEELEKIGAKAFIEGGADAEKIARDEYRELQQKKKRDEMAEFRAWQIAEREKRVKYLAEHGSPITPFTEEELEQREREAKAASAAERRMFDIGIDKVASRYWQLEGKAGNGVDVLDEAIEQMSREADDAAAAASLSSSSSSSSNADTASANFVDSDDIEIEISDDAKKSIMSSVPADEGNSSAITDAFSLICSNVGQSDTTELAEPVEKCHIEHVSEGISLSEPDLVAILNEQKAAAEAEAAAAAEAAAIAAAEKEEERRQLQREEDERAQVVAESIAIYKRKQAEERAQKENTNSQSYFNIHSQQQMSSTWNAPIPEISPRSSCTENTSSAAETVAKEKNKPLYWTEAMDFELAKLVRLKRFNFEEIAKDLKSILASGTIGLLVQLDSERITVEQCRLRWSQLDAEQWSELAPNTTALDFVHKICVSSEILKAGSGAQPTFQALQSMSASCTPSYLTKPVLLPSMNDYSDDDDDDDDNDGGGDDDNNNDKEEEERGVEVSSESEALLSSRTDDESTPSTESNSNTLYGLD